MKKSALLACLFLCTTSCEEGDGEDAKVEAWSDEGDVEAEASGTIVGEVGGLSFFATLDQGSYWPMGSTFMIGGNDFDSYDEEYVMITLSVDADLMSVGTFDCTVLGEARITANIPTEGVVLGSVEQSFFDSMNGDICSITVDSFGKVGDPVTGSFAARLGDGEGYEVALNGTFDILRGSVL